MTRTAKINPDGLRKLLSAGHSTADIAAHFGVQSPAVTRACHAYGLPLPQGSSGHSGARKEPSRADDERDLGFLRCITSGLGYERTARRYGVSGMTVQKMVKAIESADLNESGEPVEQVSRAYPRQKRGGRR
jgi:hypothetical protein